MDDYIQNPDATLNFLNRNLEAMGITTLGQFPEDEIVESGKTIQAVYELL